MLLAWMGVLSCAMTVLSVWQKFYKPFGLVSVFDADDGVLAVYEEEKGKLVGKVKNMRERGRLVLGKVRNMRERGRLVGKVDQ